MLAEPSTAAVEPTLTPQVPASDTPAAEAPSTPSTSQDAVKAGDARAFREARHKERVDRIEGKTPPPVERPVEARTEQPPKKKSLEGRKVQVDAEVEDLKRQLAVRDELRRQLKTTETPPKVETKVEEAKPAKPSWADDPKAPKIEQFERYEDYLDARAEFIADKRFEQRMAERDQRASQETTARQKLESVTKTGQSFKERVETYQKANPTTQFAPQLVEIMPMSAIEAHNAQAPPDQQLPIGAEHFIIEQVFRSECPGELLAHLSNPDVFQPLYELAQRDPGAVVRKIGALEHQLASSASPATSPSARVSTVPNPPTVLGGKVASLDPIRAAVKNGDARSYRAMRHQERIARIGSR